MELERMYFFTATIHKWIPLLTEEKFKKIIISSLKYLTDKQLIKIYGFVIMPNHIHLIWELLDLNKKEMPHASFLKFTSHQFLKDLRKNNQELLTKFKVEEVNKAYCFWQRDSLPIELYSPQVIFQKLEYIHNNPCRGKWMLVDNPLNYPYSSFGFYENGIDGFGFLNHVGERI
ncbi:hypothetical protein SAMN00777080_0448 [Aquiflexum balticum DSM 16537]|uniref:Transposase IS200-like domain-containing protein n=1 Tax=Aquiflexum balticum DSM 16537 TaxID=758820 RepID=A0A1W2GZD9_9BACT|nr:transposase [Aquiflexum balticum]SMD41914.1 hypothetical protein SAMN00777080_0448 [Aquiflexum balticum DSM 16537]